VTHHREGRGESIDEEAAVFDSPIESSRRHHTHWRLLLWRKLRYLHYKRSIVVFTIILVISTIKVLLGLDKTELRKNFRTQRRVPRFNTSIPYDHLIVVAGHAVLMEIDKIGRADRDESIWYLEDYQRGQDLPFEFVTHVKAGVERAARDPNAMLLFSGGQTRPDAGPRSEALSYYLLAEYFNWWNFPFVAERTQLEEYARDSFENLLFSLCRFSELSYGRYPKQLSVVSFNFKRTRFERLHAPALRFPPHRFQFIPQNPLANYPRTRFNFARAAQGEANTILPFRRDPYACFSDLKKKRKSRDPFHRSVPYGGPSSCSKMAPLLSHCGPHYYNASKLPWAAT